MLTLTTAAIAPLTTAAVFPCEGIRAIERATGDRPLAFASLREQGKILTDVRDATGLRVQREVAVTNVKSLAGFTRCRFVYSSHIDLACYVGATVASEDAQAKTTQLTRTAESVGTCLTNSTLVRAEAEAGSAPAITYGNGSRHPFWQVSMVPTEDGTSRFQPEVLILAPVAIVTPPRVARPLAKGKRKTR